MKHLFIIPSPISTNTTAISAQVIRTLEDQRYFICERIRTSRRLIKKLIPGFDINEACFYEIPKASTTIEDGTVQEWFVKGNNVALMSEAGLPCIADPGSKYVKMAREYGYKIMPLSGPSSIFLALMASGLNGQQFTFHGYLPIKQAKLVHQLKIISNSVVNTNYSQIFIETPYRNLSMMKNIIYNIPPHLSLCVAMAINEDVQYIDTQTIKHWKNNGEIEKIFREKVPTIFIIGKNI